MRTLRLTLPTSWCGARTSLGMDSASKTRRATSAPTLDDVHQGDAAADLAGLLAAFLLAFAMSVDDYVITSFIAGSTVTFHSLSTARPRSDYHEVLCFGTLIFLVASSSRWQRRAQPPPIRARHHRGLTRGPTQP